MMGRKEKVAPAWNYGPSFGICLKKIGVVKVEDTRIHNGSDSDIGGPIR